MTRRPFTLALASLVVLAALPAAPARAGLLPVSVAVTPESGNYRWTYAVVLPTDSQLRSGDYFTIYDFGGFVPGTIAAPDGWAATVADTGSTPGRIDPDDAADLPNLTFRYTGPTVNTGQTGLGNFWAVSMYGDSTDSFFAAQTHRTSDGRVDSNITETVVPVPCPPSAVPEPTALALAGLGLPLVALARRAGRRRA